MTLNELYISSVSKLEKIDNSSTEARIILKKAMSFTETDFLLNKNRILTDEEVTAAESMINRRLSGVPVQYIIGEWDFFGKTFKVNENVLIPRPETELLCEYVIDHLKDKSSPVVADLCAGSGCIGITVKDNIASACVYMVEKSSEAYKVCCENAESILVLLGSSYDTSIEAVEEMRADGKKAGAATLHVLRPFPGKELFEILRHADNILVADRQDSYGAGGGNLSLEVRAAMQKCGSYARIKSLVYGLGGKDFFKEDAKDMIAWAQWKAVD